MGVCDEDQLHREYLLDLSGSDEYSWKSKFSPHQGHIVSSGLPQPQHGHLSCL